MEAQLIARRMQLDEVVLENERKKLKSRSHTLI